MCSFSPDCATSWVNKTCEQQAMREFSSQSGTMHLSAIPPLNSPPKAYSRGHFQRSRVKRLRSRSTGRPKPFKEDS